MIKSGIYHIKLPNQKEKALQLMRDAIIKIENNVYTGDIIIIGINLKENNTNKTSKEKLIYG